MGLSESAFSVSATFQKKKKKLKYGVLLDSKWRAWAQAPSENQPFLRLFLKMRFYFERHFKSSDTTNYKHFALSQINPAAVIISPKKFCQAVLGVWTFV